MIVYYAHSLHLYNIPQEKRDLELLKKLGFIVFNPNSPAVQVGVEEFKKEFGNDKVMEYFNDMLNECDCLAFRGHVDGKIPSGVGYEIEYMLNKNKPVFELPTLIPSRYLDKNETRLYLQLNGNR